MFFISNFNFHHVSTIFYSKVKKFLDIGNFILKQKQKKKYIFDIVNCRQKKNKKIDGKNFFIILFPGDDDGHTWQKIQT